MLMYIITTKHVHAHKYVQLFLLRCAPRTIYSVCVCVCVCMKERERERERGEGRGERGEGKGEREGERK